MFYNAIVFKATKIKSKQIDGVWHFVFIGTDVPDQKMDEECAVLMYYSSPVHVDPHVIFSATGDGYEGWASETWNFPVLVYPKSALG